MAQNPHLQNLFTHPQYGFLFPHQCASTAFGVPNEYHIYKHRPKLTEGLHYLKLRGNDHIDRLYYTLGGLLLLADFIGNPYALQFKESLVEFTRGGAIVPATPVDLYQSPPNSSALYAEPIVPTPVDSNFSPPAPLTPSDPAYLVGSFTPSPGLEVNQAVAQSIAAQQQTLNETAAIIFAAQNLTAQHILTAQEKAKPPEVKVTVNLFQQWDDWLNSQDFWATAIVGTMLFALLSAGSYFVTSTFTRPEPTPSQQPQSTWSQPQ